MQGYIQTARNVIVIDEAHWGLEEEAIDEETRISEK